MAFDEMAFDEQSFDEVAFGFDQMVFDQMVDSIKMAFDEVVGRQILKSELKIRKAKQKKN
jgi:hypothetical protein